MTNQDLTLKDVLEATAGKYPERIALSFVGGEPITYAGFLQLTRDLGTLLAGLGVEPGDKVAIIGENMPNWAVTYFAVVSMGAIAVPILQEFHESAVHHILRHSEAQIVVASNRYMHKVEVDNIPNLKTVMLMDDLSVVNDDAPKTNFAEAVLAARDKFDELGEKARKYMDRNDSVSKKNFTEAIDSARDKFEELGEKAKKYIDRKKKDAEPVLTADSVAAILYTSGTTGHSKGVVLTHRNLVSNTLAGVQTIPIVHTDRFLSVLPMAHTYECTVGLIIPVHCGSAVHYLRKPPTPKTLLPAMQTVKPTVINVVPLIIEKIYKNRIKPKLSKGGLMGGLMKIGSARRKVSQMAGKKLIEAFGGELRCMCIGGAALSPEVESFLDDAGFPYAIGYGMTETSPLLAGTRPGFQRLRGIGPVLPGIELRIDNPDPKTGEGEVLAKGPNVMREYYKAPKDTVETFTDDGFLRTGDLGVFDDDGYLYIKGRLKNVIIGASGENIYPEEVESIINSCDFVLESMVYDSNGRLSARIHLNYDVLDDELGTGKMIESEVRDKFTAMLEDIRKEVNSKVSTFARLNRVVEQVEPFEKTPTQKIKRFIYLDN
ncbi:AMP-binding protein [Pseudodesulfovibrio sp.]|nr:AMP-binding protein [Pseudodesulfovibrio sp.]